MVVPGMMNMAEVMAESGDTEEDVFDCGISGQLVFVVVVPLVGACRVPVEALSHFMAGADDYAAEGMPEHWSAALSGKWTIKRNRLRILADSWDKLSTERDKTIEAFEAKFKPKQANVQRAHRLAANCYEIYEAAASIALQLGQDKTNEERLREDMAQAAFDGKLTVRSPSGYDQYAPTRSPEWTYDYCALTTPGDVNKWAEEKGLHWTWEPNCTAPLATSVVMVSAPGGVEPDKAKRRTWRDVAWRYVLETFKAGQFSTAKGLYYTLETKAGSKDSPFDKGTGVNRHALYVREISDTVTLKTIQNAWTEIKASGQTK